MQNFQSCGLAICMTAKMSSRNPSFTTSDTRPAKRQRTVTPDVEDIRAKRIAYLTSLSRAVSPPPQSQDVKTVEESDVRTPHQSFQSTSTIELPPSFFEQPQQSQSAERSQSINPEVSMIRGKLQKSSFTRTFASPFRLLKTQGVSSDDNYNTISLRDILGDPLIKQAWIFNFCFDVDWTMKHFDADVRELVDVKIVHGSWRKEDGNRQGIQEALTNWKNVKEVTAYMPDQFGTHHSKMIVLFKHDDTAQVVIHTANMLDKDWNHMTQAAWVSPSLPLERQAVEQKGLGAIGSGRRFKHDLLRYFKAYGSKLKALSQEMSKYDFSQVRGALVTSVPSDTKVGDSADEAWGHLNLRHSLKALHSHKDRARTRNGNIDSQHLVCQVSSIATLPAYWLQNTVYKAATPTPPTTGAFCFTSELLTTSIIYPTPSDMQDALTGYATGGSIHTKTSTPNQLKQVTSLRPELKRWGKKAPNPDLRAGRHNIPPHIKTYICFESEPSRENPTPDIEWALLTSANLSQQAWGTVEKPPRGVINMKSAQVHVASFEVGVLVWPELYLPESSPAAITSESPDEDTASSQSIKQPALIARMVPVFGQDTPQYPEVLDENEPEPLIVGLRMPYDLPLTPYRRDELPWSPNAVYREPDRLGQTWGVEESNIRSLTSHRESQAEKVDVDHSSNSSGSFRSIIE